MLRDVEPDSLLVRGLVDNASRGLSPALDRSTTFERVAGGSSPYGRGHAPVAAEAEALLGALEDGEATVFASGMTAWTCICLTTLSEGTTLALPTSGYYSLEGFTSEILECCGVANVLSQHSSAPPACAACAATSMSVRVSSGLDGVSMSASAAPSQARRKSSASRAS